MRNTRLGGLSSIAKRFKGTLEMAEMRIKEVRGQSVINGRSSVNAVRRKSAAAFPSHVAAVSGDGTAEGGLGEVLYGVGLLGGQTLAGDWP